MDKDTIDKLINFKFLEIKDKQLDEEETTLFLYQVDSLGNIIEGFYEFRVTIDNRRK